MTSAKAPVADICIVVEGCYPFVAGGVSSWLDWLLRKQPDTSFSVVAITADAAPRELKYELPPNVISFSTLPLMPAAERPVDGQPDLDAEAYAKALLGKNI